MSLWSKIVALFRGELATIKSKGSAFIRVAEHDAQVLEAKGKLIALEAANKATTAALEELEAGAKKVHEVRDALESRIASIHAAL